MAERCSANQNQTCAHQPIKDLQKTGGAELRGAWLTSEWTLTEPLFRLFPIEQEEEIEKVIQGKKKGTLVVCTIITE